MVQNLVAQSQVVVANTGVFRQILKKVSHFLVAKSGYQQPKSGSQSNFQVAWGYQATTKSYTVCKQISCVTLTASRISTNHETNSMLNYDAY